MRNVSILVLSILLGALVSVESYAQSPKPEHKYQQKAGIKFEIVSIEDAHFISTDGCAGFKMLTIFVEPEFATEEAMRNFATRIAATFPSDFDLTMEFFSERKYSLFQSYDMDSDEERVYFKSFRGLYFRSSAKEIEKLVAFPDGTSREELEFLFPEN